MIQPLKLNKNECTILECIIREQEISQNEIANLTNTNRSIVSKTITGLENTNLLLITNDKNKKMISFNHAFSNTILIEIDRYYIHAFLNTSLGYNLHQIARKINIKDVSDLFNQVELIIDELLSISETQIIGIGFSVHGIVERNHKIAYAPNTNWTNLDLKSTIEAKYEIFTTVLNVANVSVLSENVLSSPSLNSQVSINIHSGVGAGFILNDDLYIGSNGHSLEIGHFHLFGNDNICDCGASGCLETEISYPALIKKMEAYGYKNASIELFIELYLQHVRPIELLYNEYLDYLAFGLRNLFLVIDPDEIRINCQIMQAIPKSIEILKSKIQSPIIDGSNISISNLNSSTRCLGLSTQLCKGFLGLHSINLYNQRQNVFKSYK